MPNLSAIENNSHSAVLLYHDKLM